MRHSVKTTIKQAKVNINEQEIQWNQNPRETIDNRNRPIRNPDSGVTRQKL